MQKVAAKKLTTFRAKNRAKKSGLSRLQYFMIIFIKHQMTQSKTPSTSAEECKPSVWQSQEITPFSDMIYQDLISC